ncbi:hypothetical protein RhiirA5_407476 [Rhizophagus irregularis]|uniref:Uncharacterized protein n=1 Tax=Rhizophagus irregularis TaxID=588596 RepID=A0A2N0QAF0_9GLOM|nr:hypothetical protein RhiirA5_407476 [Rhizophagus irregularis]
MQSELDLLKQHVLAENATFTRRFSFKKIYPFKELDNIQLSRCWSSIINSQHFKVFVRRVPYKFKLLHRASRDSNTTTAEQIVGGYNGIQVRVTSLQKIGLYFHLQIEQSKNGGSNPRFSYPKVGIPVRFIIKDYETFQAIRFESLKNIDRLKKVIQ